MGSSEVSMRLDKNANFIKMQTCFLFLSVVTFSFGLLSLIASSKASQTSFINIMGGRLTTIENLHREDQNAQVDAPQNPLRAFLCPLFINVMFIDEFSEKIYYTDNFLCI